MNGLPDPEKGKNAPRSGQVENYRGAGAPKRPTIATSRASACERDINKAYLRGTQ